MEKAEKKIEVDRSLIHSIAIGVGAGRMDLLLPGIKRMLCKPFLDLCSFCPWKSLISVTQRLLWRDP